LELLKKLNNVKEFSELRLVGGTSLALQIGHRKSIDLDLFGKIEIEYIDLMQILLEIGKVEVLKKSKNINIFLIDDIKVDIVNYHYNWLANYIDTDNLRLAELKDISAMKFAAITGRGSKKDFIDIHFLLEIFTFKEMMELYNQKYHDGSEFIVLKSIIYFDDADNDEEPVMIKPINWEKVKSKIISELNNYLKNDK
jgi:hypothetical protein